MEETTLIQDGSIPRMTNQTNLIHLPLHSKPWLIVGSRIRVLTNDIMAKICHNVYKYGVKHRGTIVEINE